MNTAVHNVEVDQQFLLVAKERGFTVEMQSVMLSDPSRECWQHLVELGLRVIEKRNQRAFDKQTFKKGSVWEGGDCYLIQMLSMAQLKLLGTDSVEEILLAAERGMGLTQFKAYLPEAMEKMSQILGSTKAEGMWLAGTSPIEGKLLAWYCDGKGGVHCIKVSSSHPNNKYLASLFPSNILGFVFLTKLDPDEVVERS